MFVDSVFTSVNKLLEESFKKHWDLPAVSNYQGRTLAYGDIAERIAKMHIAFEHYGLQKGDKVAICAKNQANWAVSFLATLTYGAVPVPLLHEFKPGNIHHLVNHSEAKVLFTEESIWEQLNPEEMPGILVVTLMHPYKVVYVKEPKYEFVSEHLLELFGQKYKSSFGPDDLDYYIDSADELAIISYTSGTSGFSKGVMIPYRSLWANMYTISLKFPNRGPGDEVVAMLPSAHMFGLSFELLYELLAGFHIHFLTRLPSPKVIMAAFGDVKPAVIVSVPLIFEKIYKSKLKPILDRNKLLFRFPIIDKVLEKKIKETLVQTFGGKFEQVVLGGAALNPEVDAFMHRIGFPYSVGYGMTECGPLITFDVTAKSKPHSCGRVIENVEIRIDSTDPRNIPGEIQVKGANVFLGYYKNEEATAACFTEDGWLKTGDMGVIDEDGYLFLKGRSKCMILSANGQNIYPEELEAVINTFNYVQDSLIIEDNGLTALVFPDWNQGVSDGMDAEKLKEYLTSLLPEMNRQLPNYAQVKKIEFMPEDFERTPKKSIKRYLYQRNNG